MRQLGRSARQMRIFAWVCKLSVGRLGKDALKAYFTQLDEVLWWCMRDRPRRGESVASGAGACRGVAHVATRLAASSFSVQPPFAARHISHTDTFAKFDVPRCVEGLAMTRPRGRWA